MSISVFLFSPALSGETYNEKRNDDGATVTPFESACHPCSSGTEVIHERTASGELLLQIFPVGCQMSASPSRAIPASPGKIFDSLPFPIPSHYYLRKSKFRALALSSPFGSRIFRLVGAGSTRPVLAESMSLSNNIGVNEIRSGKGGVRNRHLTFDI